MAKNQFGLHPNPCSEEEVQQNNQRIAYILSPAGFTQFLDYVTTVINNQYETINNLPAPERAQAAAQAKLPAIAKFPAVAIWGIVVQEPKIVEAGPMWAVLLNEVNAPLRASAKFPNDVITSQNREPLRAYLPSYQAMPKGTVVPLLKIGNTYTLLATGSGTTGSGETICQKIGGVNQATIPIVTSAAYVFVETAGGCVAKMATGGPCP